MVRLECVEGNASKFWQIELNGTETVVTYGKIGSVGQNSTKDHGTVAKAQKFYNTQIASKKKGGYKVAGDGARSTSTSTSTRGGGRGASSSSPTKKRKNSTSNDDDDNDEDDSSDDSRDDSDSDAELRPGTKKGKLPIPPVVWLARLDDSRGYCSLCVTEENVYAGSETNGVVMKADHNGKVVQKFNLGVGVRAMVADGAFVYAVTNNGVLFDLTNDVVREICRIEKGVDEINFFLDICGGQIAYSDNFGNLKLLNGEGEIVFEKTKAVTKVDSGWMCRIDTTGVYHGHSKGIDKYDFKGNKLWRNDDIKDICCGALSEQFVFASGYPNRGKGGRGTIKIDKRTGETKMTFGERGTLCACDEAGKRLYIDSCYYNADTGKKIWSYNWTDGTFDVSGMVSNCHQFFAKHYLFPPKSFID